MSGSCTLDLPADVSDAGAIRAVLRAEGDLMVAQDIGALMALWGDASFVADAKNTPDNPDDDQQWLDKDAIRHRYVRTVFPATRPRPLPPTCRSRSRRHTPSSAARPTSVTKLHRPAIAGSWTSGARAGRFAASPTTSNRSSRPPVP
ncbi:MAG: hypothetical protein R2854_12830 [Caldilineaceae bacterium]